MEHPSIIGDELASPFLNYARLERRKYFFDKLNFIERADKNEYLLKYLGRVQKIKDMTDLVSH